MGVGGGGEGGGGGGQCLSDLTQNHATVRFAKGG